MRLCLACNNSCTCMSVNGALTGLQCRIFSRLKKPRPLILQCARSPLRTPRKRTKIPCEVSQVLFKHPCVQSFAAMHLPVVRESVFFLERHFYRSEKFNNFQLEKILNTCALYGIC